MPNADAKAERQPERNAHRPSRADGSGDDGPPGTSARSTTRTLLVRLLATTRSSFSRVSSWL